MDRKEILITRDKIISYDEENCYINEERIQRNDGENSNTDPKKIAELCKLKLKDEASYEPPYFEMMSRFQQALRKENILLIIIGFGFKEKHIQNAILEAVNQNPSFQLVIINYSSSNVTIDRQRLKDFFDDKGCKIIKRNVTIIFDTFRNFVNNYPDNKAYLEKYEAYHKVYAYSDAQISEYIKEFRKKDDEKNEVYVAIGKLASNNALCSVSLNSLFGRHCAVIGTTGGGKSWTVAKLIEGTKKYSNSKVILFDATEKYKDLADESYILGINSNFPYQKLSVFDLFYLLRPKGQSQRPILLEAIRSLKIQGLRGEDDLYIKTCSSKDEYNKFYKLHIAEIEDNLCNFNINLLAKQILEECVYPRANYSEDLPKWGSYDMKTYDYQTSLILRIAYLLNTNIFRKSLGFDNIQNKSISIIDKIDEFLSSNGNGILRVGFEDIPSSFYAKEIVSNALVAYLLTCARNKIFTKNPLLLFLDEAHQFSNKKVKDEFFEMHALDAFDLIAKETRKYGLFLYLSTQMPRDIPIGTLSQIGTFIVHRLINASDKKTVENAVCSANKNLLSFLPMLGAGEVLLIGVNFPMPLILKIDKPKIKPDSNTPKLKPA